MAAIAIASLRIALLAALGSAVGLAVSWALGAPACQLARGLFGYNAVLVMMALGGVFLATRRGTLAYATLAAATATILTPAFTTLLAPAGAHAFTWPFVITSLTFLAALPAFPALHSYATALPPDDEGRRPRRFRAA